jgi:hypothetical protein
MPWANENSYLES